jgi:hypothetical protein
MRYFSHFSAILITSLMLIFHPAAEATIISGMQNVAGVGNVNMGGLQWLSLNHTSGMSRAEVELSLQNHNNFGSGEFGWRYATLSEVKALLDQISVSSNFSYETGNLLGAEWFLSLFDPLEEFYNVRSRSYSYTHHARSTFFYGNDNECIASTLHSCVGTVRYTLDSSLNMFNDVGMFSYPEGTQDKVYSSHGTGSLLVRTVPEPATVVLFLVGLAYLTVAVRRKRTESRSVKQT